MLHFFIFLYLPKAFMTNRLRVNFIINLTYKAVDRSTEKHRIFRSWFDWLVDALWGIYVSVKRITFVNNRVTLLHHINVVKSMT